MTQDEPVTVGIDERHAPRVPVGIARRDSLSTGFDEPVDDVIIDRAVEVEHEQILFGRGRRRLTLRVSHELEMPSRLRPTEHDQRVVTGGLGLQAIEHFQPQPLNPEPLGAREVSRRASKAKVIRSVWSQPLKHRSGSRTAGVSRDHGTLSP